MRLARCRSSLLALAGLGVGLGTWPAAVYGGNFGRHEPILSALSAHLPEMGVEEAAGGDGMDLTEGEKEKTAAGSEAFSNLHPTLSHSSAINSLRAAAAAAAAQPSHGTRGRHGDTADPKARLLRDTMDWMAQMNASPAAATAAAAAAASGDENTHAQDHETERPPGPSIGRKLFGDRAPPLGVDGPRTKGRQGPGGLVEVARKGDQALFKLGRGIQSHMTRAQGRLERDLQAHWQDAKAGYARVADGFASQPADPTALARGQGGGAHGRTPLGEVVSTVAIPLGRLLIVQSYMLSRLYAQYPMGKREDMAWEHMVRDMRSADLVGKSAFLGGLSGVVAGRVVSATLGWGRSQDVGCLLLGLSAGAAARLRAGVSRHEHALDDLGEAIKAGLYAGLGASAFLFLTNPRLQIERSFMKYAAVSTAGGIIGGAWLDNDHMGDYENVEADVGSVRQMDGDRVGAGGGAMDNTVSNELFYHWIRQGRYKDCMAPDTCPVTGHALKMAVDQLGAIKDADNDRPMAGEPIVSEGDMAAVLLRCRQRLEMQHYHLDGSTLMAVDLYKYLACYGKDDCNLDDAGKYGLSQGAFLPLAKDDAIGAAALYDALRTMR